MPSRTQARIKYRSGAIMRTVGSALPSVTPISPIASPHSGRPDCCVRFVVGFRIARRSETTVTETSLCVMGQLIAPEWNGSSRDESRLHRAAEASYACGNASISAGDLGPALPTSAGIRIHLNECSSGDLSGGKRRGRTPFQEANLGPGASQSLPRVRAAPYRRAGLCRRHGRSADQVRRHPGDHQEPGAQGPAWMDRVRPSWREHPGLVATHESFVFRDPPDHTRLRRHVSADFSPGKVRKWQDYISALTTEVRDAIEAHGADGSTVDLHEFLATTLPIRVISKIMGVPEADHPRLRTPLEGLRLAADGSPASKLPVIDQAGSDLIGYFAELAAKRRSDPRDDLVTSLATARDTGGGAGAPDEAVLTEAEMLQSLTLIFSAAIESMADLLLNGTAGFITHPDQADALRADPSLTAGAVEEALRFDAPVQAIGRIAAGDYSIAR